MKIIKHGHLNKDGIHFVCPVCNCEFVVEDSTDLDYNIITLFETKKCVQYTYYCPECGHIEYLGINPNKYSNGEYISPYAHIFNRSDWEERFSCDNIIEER